MPLRLILATPAAALFLASALAVGDTSPSPALVIALLMAGVLWVVVFAIGAVLVLLAAAIRGGEELPTWIVAYELSCDD